LPSSRPHFRRPFFAPSFSSPPRRTQDDRRPQAPGAAAVYLNVEEIANDPIHYQSFYARIKVLQEKGKELATVEIPYLHGNYKIVDIKARTIHSDGTVIPLVGKPEDLLVLQKNHRRRFNASQPQGLHAAQCRGWQHS
jgi:hypothetical protein